ncbi:hypothetical protein Q7P37_004567 [Cladosporium fusiforme]
MQEPMVERVGRASLCTSLFRPKAVTPEQSRLFRPAASQTLSTVKSSNTHPPANTPSLYHNTRHSQPSHIAASWRSRSLHFLLHPSVTAASLLESPFDKFHQRPFRTITILKIIVHDNDLEKMPPLSSTNGSNSQSHNRRSAHAAPSRVAIPLPLSKPRQPKQQSQSTPDPATQAPAKKEVAVQIGENNVPAPAGAQNEQKTTSSATNGVGNAPEKDAGEQVTKPMAEKHMSSEQSTPALSNGATPEESQGGPVRAVSPAHAATAKPAESQSSRKPSQIRTELPPAFVPSAGQHTPHSSSSSRQINRNPQPFQPQAHLSRPSTNSIVFGEVDSSESSPAQPQSAGSTFMPPPPMQPMQRPYQPPPFPPVSQGQPFPDPQAYPMYPPGFAPQQPWNPQRAFHPTQQTLPFPPQVQPQYRYAPHEPFVANVPPALSRSASPESAYAEAQRVGHEMRPPTVTDTVGGAKGLAEPKAMYPNQLPFRQTPFTRQMPPQQQSGPPPDFRLDMENAQFLRDHVRSQFAKPAFADCRLKISHDLDASTQRIDAHRLILARSPTLLRKLQEAAGASNATTELEIHLPGKYVSLHTFNECLKYIYGGQLPPLDPPHRQSNSFVEPVSAQVERMELALQRIATGAWLDMPAIAWRGMNVATNAMTWNTLPLALEFGLDGGISPMWTLDDGSEERGSTSSSDDSHSRTEASTSSPTYDPFATPLLQSILQFVSNSFPPDFYPDIAAPQLEVCPRLPPLPPREQQHEKNKSSRSADPRLSQIRFGELPPEGTGSPKASPITKTVSSLLFSLPFQLLKFLLEHPVMVERMGAETVGSIMRQTIAERESRRLRCLKAKQPSAVKQDNEPEEVANLYWEEHVEVSDNSRLGLRMCRKRKEAHTPPSSSEGAANAA